MSKEDYEVRNGLFYTKEHEWINIDNSQALLGITDYASKEMGDVAFVELPEKDKIVNKGDLLCEIESVKAVSEIRSPFSCKIIDVNVILEDEPEKINEAPFDEWILKVEINDPIEGLMDAKEYAAYLDTLDSE